MTLNAEDKIELTRYRLEKAKRFLDDAARLAESSSYESSVNRSYYAVSCATKALLILRGIDPETHEGAKTMLSREFIRSGILPKEFGEIFRSIQARRIDSDCGDFIEISEEEAIDSLQRAGEFIRKSAEVIEGIIKGGKT